MHRHALMLGAGLLMTACASVPIDSPTAPRNDPDAGKPTLPPGRNFWIYPHDLAFTGEARYQWSDGRIYGGDWVASIAFPAISTGIFGYPADAAARIAVETVTTFDGVHLQLARIVCFDGATSAGYRALLGAAR